MASNSVPITDDENPFYCPSVTAASFLETLKQRVHSVESLLPETFGPITEEFLARSFDKALDQSVSEDDLFQLCYQRLPLEQLDENDSSLDSIQSALQPKLVQTKKMKPLLHLSETFSDFAGSPQREMSLLSANEGSFELSGKADRLRYFLPQVMFSPLDYKPKQQHVTKPTENAKMDELNARVCFLQEELYGPPIETESFDGINSLISRLDKFFPGSRLKEKLQAMNATSHQRIVDILALDGNLSSRVLDIFRSSEIEFLDLAESVTDETGLNLDSDGLLHVFAKPNSFLFLAEINLTGVKLQQSDIICIHHLPRLARLWLSGSGIGNEAIFLLAPLRRSLTDLDIAYNPNIDDDSVPTLLSLIKLQYLTILGTNATISGVRRLASAFKGRAFDVEFEVPAACEEYVAGISRRYPSPTLSPIITDPRLVRHLSNSAIKKSLAIYAKYDANISVHGTKAQMTARLSHILEIREADFLVQAMVKPRS